MARLHESPLSSARFLAGLLSPEARLSSHIFACSLTSVEPIITIADASFTIVDLAITIVGVSLTVVELAITTVSDPSPW